MYANKKQINWFNTENGVPGERVNLIRENKKITINEFRKWIIDNYEIIQTHYDNLLNNKIDLFIPFS